MKRYIRSATLDDIQNYVIELLSVPGVSYVEIVKRYADYILCKLHYTDNTTSSAFKVAYKSIQSRQDASTVWNPAWSITDDGTVVDESGNVQGYFKLLKKRPQTTSRDYDEGSLVVYYGTQSADLSEDSATKIAEKLHK